MSERILDERKRALEESFFAQHNQRLLEELRAKDKAEKRREALAAASGITDQKILDALIGLDIDAESFAALSLVPLVVVAWADGEVADEENRAALRAAEQVGLRPGDEAYQLLEGWLLHRPDPQLLPAWRDYIGAVAAELDEGTRSHLRDEVLGRARRVAEAAGGFLGLASVSAEEKQVLENLETAFG